MYTDKYLSIDAILAEEERVPVEFQVGAVGLGHLDPTSGAADIDEGQRVDLPLWLAEKLADSRLVAIDLPRNFSRKVRESMLASPQTVKLREKSPYFYEVGLRLAVSSLSEEATRLPAALQSTLATRCNMILLKSQNSSSTDPSRFLEGLTDFEQKIFWSGYKYSKQYLQWKQGKAADIKATAGVGSSASGTKKEAPSREVRSFSGVPYKRKRSLGLQSQSKV